MNKYATVGGVLSVVSGAFGILGGLAVIFVAVVLSRFIEWADYYSIETTEFSTTELGNLIGVLYGTMGGFLLVLGILALIGGIFALKKKLWGLALTGSIAALLTFFPVGVVAVIFTSMAKPEFSVPVASTPVFSPPPA